MNDKELLRNQLQAMLDKAQRTLKAARQHFQAGDHDFASSKAYYAVFHVMQAALLTKGLTFSKHAGVIGAFAQHFLKAGFFPKEWSRAIQKLRHNRETGDYGYLLSIGQEEAQEDLKKAEEIVKAVERYVLAFMQGLGKQ